jgi:WD40 repeat protein
MAEQSQATSSVFISYSRKNKAFAQKLNDSLDNSGVEAWVDWEGIPLSSDWMDEITRAIEGADAFLFIISPDSLASDVCKDELELGLKYNKKLVPILHLEPEKGQTMHDALAATNWVYMREQDDFDATLPALIDTIQTDLGWVRQHTRILQRAKEWEGKEKDNSLLLQGTELSGAETWMVEASAQDGREVVPLQGEYIQSSRLAATKRQRNLLIGVSLALVVSIGMAIFALISRSEAVSNEHARATQQVIAEQNEAEAVANEQARATQQVIAEENEKEAIQNAILAQAQRAAAEARIYQAQAGALDLSTLLAIDSWQRSPSFLAEDILRRNTSMSAIPVVQMKQGDSISRIKESPDGKYFASASEDGSVCLWDVLTGAQKLCVQQESAVYDILFSGDSSFFAAGGDDGTVRLWHVADGALLQSYEFGETEIWDIDLRPTGDLMDLEAKPREQKFESAVYKVVYSPNGEWLGIGNSSGRTFLWNTDKFFTYEGATHTDEVYALDFSADGRWMVTGGADSVVRATEVTANGLARKVMTHGDWVEFVQFSPGDNWFVSASDDNKLRVWDVETGIEKMRMEHSGFVLRIDISDNGAWIASTGADQTARVWDAISGSQMIQIPLESRGSSILFNETATRLMVGDNAGNLTLWDTSSLLARLNIIEFPELVHEARYSPDGSKLAVNTDQRNVWSLPVADTLSMKDGALGTEIITTDSLTYDLTYSPDSVWVAAAASRANKVLLYKKSAPGEDNQDAEYLREILLDSKVYAVDFSPDSTQLATADGNGFVRIWDLQSGDEVATLENSSSVRGLGYHPEGKTIAVSIKDQIVIWDIESQKQLHTLSHVGSLDTIGYSDDGKWFASASSEGTIYLWDVENNYALSDTVLQLNGQPYGFDFSPDGHYLAAGSTNYFAYVWDLTVGQEVTRLPHNDVVSSVEFSPDGFELATASRKVVQIWDFPSLPVISEDTLVESACSHLVSNMSQSEWDLFYAGQEYRPLCTTLGAAE